MIKAFNKNIFQKWLIFPLLAILCFLLTQIADNNSAFIELYYSQTIYPLIAQILSGLSSAFSFSLDDIFYFVLLIIPFLLIGLLAFRKISFKTSAKIILNICAIVYLMFYIFWGFNYFRENLSERLQIQTQKTNKQTFITITKELIARTNNLHCSFKLEPSTVDSLVEDSYRNLAGPLKISYPMGKRDDKKITVSNFYAKSGITGYFGPFFNEVHVNKKALPIEYPFILAHEKAHQLGITSEAEANFYAWMVCSFSNSQELQYSANLIILHHFLNQAYKMEEFPELIKQIDLSVRTDMNSRIQYWKQLRHDKLDRAASKVNDAYLKTNKVKAGIKDYSGVVKHVMNFSLDSTFQQKHNLVIR